MALNPIFRPQPSQPRQSRNVPAAADRDGQLEPEVVSQLARWQSILSAHGGGAVAADLALDLVLNEIVEVTRQSTHADAAAIALARDGEIVCRATMGDGAPGLGVRVSGDTGLSAACLQTGCWQRCDDSEGDPRVDAELCRRLGVRSILVVPVLKAGELMGVLEIFSAHASAFGDREVRTLQMLSRSIVENIELARRAAARVEAALPREAAGGSQKEPAEAAKPFASGERPETADFWTGALMVAVVVLAVTLGWMVGRSGRQGSRANVVRQGNPSLQTKAEAVTGGAAATPAVKPGPEISAAVPGGELSVYQDGKKVFPRPPQATDAERDSTTAARVQPAVKTSKVEAVGPTRIPAEVAAGWVTRRVEPEYPQSARERRVQGSVVLEALVGRDGVVERFTAIRGDPELAAAASAAVRQWRFKPYVSDGKEEAFQTSVTVVFRLP
jgi:TonB family protein